MSTDTEQRQTAAPQTVYLTSDQYQRLHAVDKEWIGSEHYMGLAYFWAWEYRHPMREATTYQRVRVHRAFMDAGLELDGESPEHRAIINRIVPESPQAFRHAH